MSTCHYCHEPITRHESWTQIVDWSDSPTRVYHNDCHRLDLYKHRDRGERLPEDRESPTERRSGQPGHGDARR